MRSTFEPWLFILLSASLIVIMWETAKNLWLNWGTTNFWVSSLVAALVGMFVWWGIGAIAYLSAPRKTKARKGNFRDFIRSQFYLQQKYRGPEAHGERASRWRSDYCALRILLPTARLRHLPNSPRSPFRRFLVRDSLGGGGPTEAAANSFPIVTHTWDRSRSNNKTISGSYGRKS